MHQLVERLTDRTSTHFADQIGSIFGSLPKLPKGIVNFLVAVVPYFALLWAVLALLAGPLLGFLSIVSFITLNPIFVLSVMLAAVLSVVMAIILFLAFNPLRARQAKGWMLLFWANMISVAETVVMILLGQSGILDLVFIAIGLYILYQMRPHYNLGAAAASAVKSEAKKVKSAVKKRRTR